MITAIVWRFSTVTGKTNGSGNAEIKHQECESIADRPAVRLPLSSPAPCLPAPWPPPTSSAPSSDPTPWPEEAPCDASRDSRSALVPSSGVDSRGHGSAYRKSQAAEAVSQMSPDTERNLLDVTLFQFPTIVLPEVMCLFSPCGTKGTNER